MNWFKKHKFLTVVLVIIVIAAIAGAAGGGTDTGTNQTGNQNAGQSGGEKTYRFDDRADKQVKDVEVLPNEPATIEGVKMTVAGVEYKTSVSDFETAENGKTYVVADVSLENTSDRTQPYNVFDFRVQTAGGQVLDGAFATVASPLSSGDLVAGGKAQGQVVFEVPVEEGSQYIIWKPSGFGSDRAIVKIK